MRSSMMRLAAVVSAILPAVQAACSRTQLIEWSNTYLTAQAQGVTGKLNGTSNDFVYQENNKTMEITAGVLRRKLRIDHNRTIADPETCATYTELISTDPAQPYVIGSQIRHRPDDGQVFLIDSIVSTTGSWLFNATKTLEYVVKEKWDPIPQGKYDSRVALRQAADAYLDMWSSETSVDAVPWGTPCVRLEGSSYTGNGSATDSCKVGIPTNHHQVPNSHRRYVTDETFGSISVLCIFEHLNNAPDSHEFRMEGGKLRYIHTITATQSGATQEF